MPTRIAPWLCVAMLVACNSRTDEPSDSKVALVRLDVSGERALLGAARPIRADSDEEPQYELFVRQAPGEALRPLGRTVRSAALAPAGVLAVTSERTLIRIEGELETPLLDGVRGTPAPRADGSIAIARDAGDFGETDIWLISANGTARALAAAPGPDDLPIALPDDRIAFVSGRTGIMSLFLVDTRSGDVVQLTNRGLSPGKPLTGFVPPPLLVESVSAEALVYDAGEGERWRVALDDGAATRLGSAR